MKLSFELVCTTDVLLQEIRHQECKRNDISATYFMALNSSWKTDWEKVNKAIMARWSLSGLRYIKDRAWKLSDAHKKKQGDKNNG